MAMVRRSVLNGLENREGMLEKGRSRPTAWRDVAEEELVCPKPHHPAVGLSFGVAMDAYKPAKKPQSCAPLPLPAVGEAGHEILDILFSKVSAAGSDRTMSCNLGSPPSRTRNPLIHDVHFAQDRAPISALKSLRKSSISSSSNKALCGTSYGPKPCVRIEGFVATAAPDSQPGVTTCA